jgi:hypothetical protein
MIYTVYNNYFGYYDINMLVKANSAKQARMIARKQVRHDYRGWAGGKSAAPKSSTVRIANEDFIAELGLQQEYKALNKKRTGTFVIYDEGT